MAKKIIKKEDNNIEKERYHLLETIEDWLEFPMIILGFIWLILLLIELTSSLTPFLRTTSTIIWIVFIIDFMLKFILAPKKALFLRKNILTTISLFIPAFRIFRITRFFKVMGTLRAARGLSLVKMLSSVNRGMRSLGDSMNRRGFSYVLLLTLIVTLTGAAGMLAFERNEVQGFKTYGESLWWTAMLLTSLGSEYWPKSSEGRALCFILALYGFTVFGYFTATLATFFIGSDANNKKAEIAGSKQIDEIRNELIILRRLLENQAKSKE